MKPLKGGSIMYAGEGITEKANHKTAGAISGIFSKLILMVYIQH